MLILNKLSCPTILSTSLDRAIFSYSELIVIRNLLVCTVEDQIVRNFSKYEERFSRKFFQTILHSLVKLVENKIASEMRSTKDAILHDGSTSSGTDYLGIFASYCTVKNTKSTSCVCTLLLSIIPLAKKSYFQSNFGCTAKATEWDTETHELQIRDIFDLSLLIWNHVLYVRLQIIAQQISE